MSIMGPYRSGKSFLLDQLVPHEPGVLPFKVFIFLGHTIHFVFPDFHLDQVGDTVKPETEEVSLLILPPCATNAKVNNISFVCRFERQDVS